MLLATVVAMTTVGCDDSDDEQPLATATAGGAATRGDVESEGVGSETAAGTSDDADVTAGGSLTTEVSSGGVDAVSGGAEVLEAGSEAVAAGSEAAAAGSEAATAGSEVAAAGSEAATAGSEAPAAGSEGAAAGSEVAAAGSEAPAAGSEAAAAGSEAATAGSEAAAAGSEARAASCVTQVDHADGQRCRDSLDCATCSEGFNQCTTDGLCGHEPYSEAPGAESEVARIFQFEGIEIEVPFMTYMYFPEYPGGLADVWLLFDQVVSDQYVNELVGSRLTAAEIDALPELETVSNDGSIQYWERRSSVFKFSRTAVFRSGAFDGSVRIGLSFDETAEMLLRLRDENDATWEPVENVRVDNGVASFVVSTWERGSVYVAVDRARNDDGPAAGGTDQIIEDQAPARGR